MLLNIFHYDFIIRGLVAGIIIAIVAPVVGIFFSKKITVWLGRSA